MLNIYFDTEDNRKPFELPGAKPHYNPDRPGQVNHIFLDLVLNIPDKSFQGTCTITLTPVRKGITELTLDGVNLKIESVLIDGVSQPYDYDGQQLIIHLLNPTEEKPINIAIAYRVEHPQRGLYFIGPDDQYPHKPVQVWTQGEDEDSRFWFPCFDYPGQLATSEIRVKVPKPYLAISNGELIHTEEVGEEKIFHWMQKQIHPTYLMTLAVGDFAEMKDQWHDIPVTYYVEKGREEDGRRSMGKTPRMIDFFSYKFGYRYPYPKYAQVCVGDFIFGGMENTSTTLLTDRCLIDHRAAIDNRSTESLVAHELAHQWFGDLVVIKHWSHAWIKEGMASYSEVLWTEQEYGQEEAAYYLLREARNYLEEDSSRYRRPIVTHIYREAIELYDRHLYEKGACVYHMIRTILGDELFDKAIHTFVNDNAHKTVETIDLLRAIDKSTGYNLSFLFDQYVFRGGHPDYQVSYAWDGNSKLAKITVTQTQAKDNEKDLFDLKIPVGFGYIKEKDDKTKIKLKTYTLRIHEKEQTFYFPRKKKPDFVSFDVGNNFLKTVVLEYPLSELVAQLKYDPDPISRIYAAVAIAKKGGLEAVEVLSEALKKEPFWGVRLETAKQLAKIQLDQAVTALIKGLEDDNPKVRCAVVEGLGEIKTLSSYDTLKSFLSRGDASYYTEAATAKVLGGMVSGNLKEKEGEVIELLKTVLQERGGWNEIVRSGAIGGLSQLKTSSVAVDVILEYTKPGVPQPLRLAAIRALGGISTGQSPDKVAVILENLESISKETFFLTQVAVVSSLGQMETPKAIGILQSLADQTPDGRVRRIAEEAIEKVRKNLGSDKAIKELREEVDHLKQENQDLKSRLAKLEAKAKK
ncbi:Peptidase M1 membrane alanine aminopeptidase [Gloeothece citriformis PCC 7424]|uniref:Aminopeptidase N n=1 Tax=Gloeothece citriformis (strain PCC 7424) TaxID=65393 RepID=B7K6U7_GLOC7|nr:M1 family metallopeptidase [Gloeothece citriformis]ACK72646.1 Peptidase M1 membrane alanine aminopeptidase [Gloeothece citriformis PCC 7424]